MFKIEIKQNLVSLIKLVNYKLFFYICVEIIADEILTRKIEGIEDALGNEVYFFSLKTERPSSFDLRHQFFCASFVAY